MMMMRRRRSTATTTSEAHTITVMVMARQEGMEECIRTATAAQGRGTQSTLDMGQGKEGADISMGMDMGTTIDDKIHLLHPGHGEEEEEEEEEGGGIGCSTAFLVYYRAAR